VASNVTSFGGWGLGSYCYFNVNPAVNSYNAFESPSTGVAWHDLLTVSLGGVGTITHVINNTGAVTASNTTPSDVVSFREHAERASGSRPGHAQLMCNVCGVGQSWRSQPA
jgi:hypothetical protein